MWTFITRAISAIHRHLSERLLQMLLYMDLFPFSFFFLSIYHTDINIESYTRCIREKENAGRLKRSPTLIAFAINARPFLSRRWQRRRRWPGEGSDQYGIRLQEESEKVIFSVPCAWTCCTARGSGFRFHRCPLVSSPWSCARIPSAMPFAIKGGTALPICTNCDVRDPSK